MKCPNQAQYEVIWGPGLEESRFSCEGHVGHVYNRNAVINTILRLEPAPAQPPCSYEAEERYFVKA